jgi:ribonuclease III
MSAEVEALEQKLGYHFQDRELVVRALTHRSWVSERNPKLPDNDNDNEQMEFLGDSILGFLVSESLVLRHPAAWEGQLSQWKSHLVSASHLHRCAMNLGLGEYLRLGRGEERNGGRGRRALLANAFEALIAALYLDGGVEPARSFGQQNGLDVIDEPEDIHALALLNYKSVLQERVQALGLAAPRYSIVETNGPEHAKIFVVEARIGTQFATRAEGSSKKQASQEAARLLIQELNAATNPGARISGSDPIQ